MHQETDSLQSLAINIGLLIDNLNLGHIKFDQKQIQFSLNIVDIPNVTIQQLDLAALSSNMGSDDILQSINNIVIDSLNIKDTIFESNLISVQIADSITLNNFQIDNCFFQTNLIDLDTINIVKIQNSQFLLKQDSLLFNYFQPLSQGQGNYIKEKKEWLVAYDRFDGARSLISVYGFTNQQQNKNQNNLIIDYIQADFGGFDSRFLSVYYSGRKLDIKNSNFSNMKSHQNGGCLRFYILTYLNISSSNFTNCISNKFGGAVSINNYLEVYFSNLNMQNNSALLGGGISIESQGQNRTLQNVFFKNNTSTFLDNDVFDYTPKFRIREVVEYIPNYYQQQYMIRNLPLSKLMKLIPGSIYIIIIELALFQNSYGNIKTTNFTSLNNIIKGNLYDFYLLNKDKVQPQDANQYLNYELDLRELSKDYSYILFQPHSTINKYKLSFIFTIPLIENDILFQTSECIEGQQKIYFNSLDNTKYLCQYCESMSANYRNNSFECQHCDSQIFSKCYLNYSELNKGYWRSSLQIDQTQIYKCQSTNQQQCLGGSGYGNQLCFEGRIGNECSACDETSSYWNATYTAINLFSCVKCDEIQLNAIKIWVSMALFIIVLFVLIHSNFKKIQNYVYQQYLIKMQMIYIGTSFTKFGLTSVYIKVLSFNTSLLLFIQNQLELSLKNTFVEKSIQYSSPLSTSFASINCALYDLFPNRDHYGIIRLKFYLIMPLIIIPIALLFPFLRFLLKKSSRRFLKYNISLTIIYTLFIVFYNPILSVCLDSITCRTFGNGEKALQIDLTAPCGQDYEYYEYAISGLVFYSILVPFYIIYNLYKNKNKLYSIKALFQFGFLYQEYKKDFCFWEIVRFSIKVAKQILIFCRDYDIQNLKQLLAFLYTQVFAIILVRKNTRKESQPRKLRPIKIN
ncbi:transmembrane protein, putative (macronuclear) [Tetrahymena thermophila SB210]|uniref:Transmembrane protein, putative n=1 Tax=Tetrahymena thermophila (strain SB210) TaxID=312017 RepID=I7LUM2_TETTS|nr:transmembrane protein, putative [Tetrahymena thermophila SB210]EAR94951.2 transmembrane protein, putative [Tetrahymena thermophila SB210]|eukprot:XP_001015196.2 transmembrane protein, putative [Tetrahymena thermophila SB210]